VKIPLPPEPDQAVDCIKVLQVVAEVYIEKGVAVGVCVGVCVGVLVGDAVLLGVGVWV
jgi:hypothetical protein